MFGFTFYRQFKYKMVTHARVFNLEPKFTITENQGLFLANSLHFLNKKFGYENMCSWAKIRDIKIQLPTKNNKIDFEFMESFIAELEVERVAEVEAYLVATGLKDYELTKEEKKILSQFESGDIKWNEYKIDELFNIESSKKRFDANKVDILESGKPYVVRTSLNNGIRGYINEDNQFLNEGNTISFGQDTATMFYQEKPYFTGDKIKIVKSKNGKLNKFNSQFFISTMTKSFSSFSWGGSSFNVRIIGNQTMALPTKNNEPDYKLMETFISAIQKLVIKDVVLYTDRKITATKSVINK
jgi:Type I restriction modification DNA specificity domain